MEPCVCAVRGSPLRFKRCPFWVQIVASWLISFYELLPRWPSLTHTHACGLSVAPNVFRTRTRGGEARTGGGGLSMSPSLIQREVNQTKIKKSNNYKTHTHTKNWTKLRWLTSDGVPYSFAVDVEGGEEGGAWKTETYRSKNSKSCLFLEGPDQRRPCGVD